MSSGNTNLVLFDTAAQMIDHSCLGSAVAVQHVLISLMVFYFVNLLGCCQRENYGIFCGSPLG